MFFTIGYNYSDNLGIDISFFETGDATLTMAIGLLWKVNMSLLSSENILRPKAKLYS